VLDELLRALHRLAVLQVVPEAGTAADESLLTLAGSVAPEDVQLYYQIGLLGRRDLLLAPDARSGLEMALLRMLAFRPVAPDSPPARAPRPAEPVRAAPVTTAAGVTRPTGTPAASTPPVSVVAPPPAPAAVAAGPLNAPWGETLAQLNLAGLVRQLAFNCALEAVDGELMQLTLDPSCANLLGKERETALRDALAAHFARPVTLRITAGNPRTETPAREQARLRGERQQAAEAAILGDPHVQALQEAFNARVNPATIRPKD
jgi:DNA polymerase-3 subunit gamma/tau